MNTILFQPQGGATGKVCLKLPNTNATDLDFSRAGDATVINEQGLLTTVGSNIPRYQFDIGETCPSLLLEPARKNLFLNSETGATQTITVVSGVDYAVSFSGTGSIAFSGGATGTLNGTSANAVDRVSSIITTTSTSVTCTITGAVEYVNFEINTDNSSVSYATSWIETTGTTATRVAETVSKTGLSSYINSSEGVLYFEGSFSGIFAGNSTIGSRISLSDNSLSNRISLNFKGATQSFSIISSTSATTTSFEAFGYTENQNYKVAINFSSIKFDLWINGTKIIDQTFDASKPSSVLNTLRLDDGEGGNPFYGNIKDLRVYNQALTDSELSLLTS